MKVLIIDRACAFLTPGGKTTHALRLKETIQKQGVDIDFARWWDESQKDADIIHFLDADPYTIKLAKQKGKKIFLSMIFDYETNLSPLKQKYTAFKFWLLKHTPIKEKMYWSCFKYVDKIQFMHKYDQLAFQRFFPEVNLDKTVIIPHAYDEHVVAIQNSSIIDGFPQKYLISCAHISPRKQTCLLAKYAKKAEVPVVFMGGAHKDDPYFQEFLSMVDNKYVFYPGYVSENDKACIEEHASGFVLLSQGESGCIAVFEAASYNLPLLLSNLPWAWGYENPQNIEFCDFANPQKAIQQLKSFYNSSSRLDHTPYTIHTWDEIANYYVQEYKKLLK